MDVLAGVPRTPLQANFLGDAVRIGLTDVLAAAKQLGCSLATIQAVLDVESSGSGFDADGRPKILFEPHVFWRELAHDRVKQSAAAQAGLAYPKQGMYPYPPTSEANYVRLKRACLIDADAAMRSCSWGIAQVMGFNYALCGYATVEDLVLDCMDSEAGQFELLLDYCTATGLAPALVRRDFTAFARGYNGPGAVFAYATKLQAAYQRHAGPGQATVLAAAAARPAAPRGAVPPVFVHPATTADALNDTEWLTVRAGLAASATAGTA